MQQINTIPFGHHKLLHHQLAKQPYDRDIIPGVYEGGFKVWECTLDLLKVMAQGKINFDGKKVLDLGCGHGLLGIAALKLGAQMCVFQDYNEDVLSKITGPNLSINNIAKERYEIQAGDWSAVSVSTQKYDIILGSELIYKEQNYLKITQLCKRVLKPDAIAILANKHYYFGVGGGMEGFKEVMEEQGMSWQTVAKIVPQRGGNKKEIIIARIQLQGDKGEKGMEEM